MPWATYPFNVPGLDEWLKERDEKSVMKLKQYSINFYVPETVEGQRVTGIRALHPYEGRTRDGYYADLIMENGQIHMYPVIFSVDSIREAQDKT